MLAIPNSHTLTFLKCALKGSNYEGNIEELSHGENRLLTLLYYNQKQKDPKLKGIAKHTLIKNHRLMEGALPFIKALQEEGISPSLLKGTAMSLLVYQNFYARAMEDVDVLIPHSEVSTGVKLLYQLGYRSEVDNPVKYLSFRHSCTFRKGPSIIDLHAYLSEECCGEKEAHPFHEKTVECAYKDTELKVLQPTELLFHTVIHGMRWNPVSPIRWITDAYAIIQTFPINWDLLVVYSQRYHLVTPMKAALLLLNTSFIQIPEEVLKRLEALPVSAMDRQEFLFHASPYNGIIRSVRHHWHHYKRSEAKNFIEFCEHYWGVHSKRQLLPMMFSKIRKKLY